MSNEHIPSTSLTTSTAASTEELREDRPEIAAHDVIEADIESTHVAEIHARDHHGRTGRIVPLLFI